jgi:hypothetical protein
VENIEKLELVPSANPGCTVDLNVRRKTGKDTNGFVTMETVDRYR